MADLRIVDAPVLLQESITDDVKMPTGGLGNYAIRLGDLVWYVVAKEQLASKSYVDTSSKGVKDSLDTKANTSAIPTKVSDLTNDSEILYFKETNKLLFNAPALIYLTLNEGHTEWSTYDLGAFGMILMLAAKNLGVDSIPAYEIVKYPDVIREYMDVPDDEEIVMGIALGYESDDEINKIVSTRLALDDILTIKK